MIEVLAACIAIGTVLAVLTRPRGISEGFWALIGGVLMLATGVLPLHRIDDVLAGITGVLVFLFGLFWLTLASDRAGLFDNASRWIVRAAGGDPRRLLNLVFVLGTVTTAVLSNDATVVLLTPVMLRACSRLDLPPLPYLFACTFVADTASSLLPISNPVNLLYAERLDISFARHASLMAAPTLAAVTVNAIAFQLLFRRQLPARFTPPSATITRSAFTTADRVINGALAIVVLGYVVSAFAGIEPYWITLFGGVMLGGIGVASNRIRSAELLRVQPPSLYAFVVGLALVVAGADWVGLLDTVGNLIVRATGMHPLVGMLSIAFGTALGTNLANNWTMALTIVRPLERISADDTLVFGSMLGADIGPNLSVVGSLATLIWLSEVRRGGLAVSGATYLRIGLIATIPAMLAGTLVLYLVARVT